MPGPTGPNYYAPTGEAWQALLATEVLKRRVWAITEREQAAAAILYLWNYDPVTASQLLTSNFGPVQESGNLPGFGDSVSLFGSGQSVASGVFHTMIMGTEDYTPVGNTFSHDGNGLITVNFKCIAAIITTIGFDDASDSTSRRAYINTENNFEGGILEVPAINGASTRLDPHLTETFLAGDTISVVAVQLSGGSLSVFGGITVTCLGQF